MSSQIARDLDMLSEQYGQSAAFEAFAERMRKFNVDTMKKKCFCLWCGDEWTDGHVAPRHYVHREGFTNHHQPYLMQKCAPVLLALDSLLERTGHLRNLSGDSLSEEAAQELFEMTDMLQEQQESLVAALDATEENRQWSASKSSDHALTKAVADVSGAVEAARQTIARLEGGGDEQAGADAAATAELLAEVDDDDDELDALGSDLIRRGPARKGGGGRRGSGGGGGKKYKGGKRGGKALYSTA